MVGASSSRAVGMVPRLGSYLRLCSTPWNHCGRRQVVTALSILCSLPRSGVFIAVVAGCRWTPLSHLSEVLPLPSAFLFHPPKLIKSVISSSTSQSSRLSGVRPSSLLPFLFWCVRLSSSRFGRIFTVPWIRYPRYTPW